MKPANILVYPNQVVKIADFGLAKQSKDSKSSISLVGTEKYTAPEFKRGSKYKVKAYKGDVYTLAITICYLMLNDVPPIERIMSKTV